MAEGRHFSQEVPQRGGSVIKCILGILLTAAASFADRLEKATIDTIESGRMTRDLALITSMPDPVVLNSRDFILAIKERLA